MYFDSQYPKNTHKSSFHWERWLVFSLNRKKIKQVSFFFPLKSITSIFDRTESIVVYSWKIDIDSVAEPTLVITNVCICVCFFKALVGWDFLERIILLGNWADCQGRDCHSAASTIGESRRAPFPSVIIAISSSLFCLLVVSKRELHGCRRRPCD